MKNQLFAKTLLFHFMQEVDQILFTRISSWVGFKNFLVHPAHSSDDHVKDRRPFLTIIS